MQTRRDVLRQLAALAGAGAGASLFNNVALAEEAKDPRFLIVLCATGGGSIIDGPLAIRASESATPSTLNTFEDALVTGWSGSPFRAVDLAGGSIGPIPAPFSVAPSEFLSRRRQDLMVATVTGTSVNHYIETGATGLSTSAPGGSTAADSAKPSAVRAWVLLGKPRTPKPPIELIE